MMMTDSQKIKLAIVDTGANINALAVQTGLTEKTISALTKQDRSVHISTLAKLATALGVKPSELLKDSVWTKKGSEKQ